MSKVNTSIDLKGKKIKRLDGKTEAITDVLGGGYKTKSGGKMIKSTRLLKKGRIFVEVEKMPAADYQDTGMGYVELVKAKAKSKAKSQSKAKDKPKSKTQSKSKAKDKSMGKKNSAKSSSKSSSSKKIAKLESTIEKLEAELAAKQSCSFDMPDVEGMSGFNAKLAKQFDKFYAQVNDQLLELEPRLSVTTGVEFFEDDSSELRIAIGFEALPLPDVSVEHEPSAKALSSIRPGLYEKQAKISDMCKSDEKGFGEDFDIGSRLQDNSSEDTYVFIGIGVVNGKAALVFDCVEREKVRVCKLSVAIKHLTLLDPLQLDLDEDEDDWVIEDEDTLDGDLDDEDEIVDLSGGSEDMMDISDALDDEDGDEDVAGETFDSIETIPFATISSDKAQEILLENFSLQTMIDYVTENYELDEDREEEYEACKEDDAGLAEFIAQYEHDCLEGEEDDEDILADDGFGDTSSLDEEMESDEDLVDDDDVMFIDEEDDEDDDDSDDEDEDDDWGDEDFELED